MTTEYDWEAITDRKRDHLVAVEIFNWKCEDRHCDGENIIRCGACGQYGHGNCYGDGNGAIQLTCDHWQNYTGETTDAWEVVDKMQSDFAWKMDMNNDAQEIDVQIGLGRATGKNVAEAICLAALRCKGISI